MEDIFDEVDGDLRAERAKHLLRRYAGVIAAVVLVTILGAGAWEAWRWNASRQDEAAAVAYLNAMNLADALPADANAAARAPAIAAFRAVAASAPQGYRALSLLRLAALEFDAGQTAAAQQELDTLAADAGADPLLRDLANLLWAQHGVDGGDPALVEARLKPLIAPGNAWHQIAQEYLGLLYMRTGKTDEARATLRTLAADPSAPEGLRGRAGAVLARLGN